MPARFCFVALLLLAAASPTRGAEPSSGLPNVSGAVRVYIGTYTHGKGPAAEQGNLSRALDLATGKLTIDGVTPAVEPSFLAIDRIAAVSCMPSMKSRSWMA